MKKLALILAILTALSLCSCAFVTVTTETDAVTKDEPLSESVPTSGPAETEPETEPATESGSATESGPSGNGADGPIVPDGPDVEGDRAAYDEISARAGEDVRCAFVKGFIDGDASAVLKAISDVDLDSEDGGDWYRDWADAFDAYRKSFKITRYSVRDEMVANEWGVYDEILVFSFAVYESDNEDMPVGQRQFDVTNNLMMGTADVNEHSAADTSRNLLKTLPEEAELLTLGVPCFRKIADGYTDDWSGDFVMMDLIYLTLPGVQWSDDAPGMTGEQISAAACELFGIDRFNVTDPPLYKGDDGLYHVGGHGGIISSYYVTAAEKVGDGYRVTVKTFADSAHIVPSDVYEVTVKPGTDRYDWVFESVKIVKRGEPGPYSFMA